MMVAWERSCVAVENGAEYGPQRLATPYQARVQRLTARGAPLWVAAVTADARHHRALRHFRGGRASRPIDRAQGVIEEPIRRAGRRHAAQPEHNGRDTQPPAH